jgi:hypothetical protein
MLSRRRFVAASVGCSLLAHSDQAFSTQQIRHLSGQVFVNNRRLSESGIIRPGDSVVVGHDSTLEFVLDDDAFRLGPRTSLTLERGRDTGIAALRLITGALLGVFGARRKRLPLLTHFGTVGIRGTGLFVSTQPDEMYACTCYGETDFISGRTKQLFSATHHDPRLIQQRLDGTLTIGATAMAHHDDEQLRRLEGYLGRVPAFDVV